MQPIPFALLWAAFALVLTCLDVWFWAASFFRPAAGSRNGDFFGSEEGDSPTLHFLPHLLLLLQLFKLLKILSKRS